MSKFLYSFILVLIIELTLGSTFETIGTIDGSIVIEQNGTQILDDVPVLVTNKEMTATVKLENQLVNTSYSWFIDDIEFKPNRSPQLKHSFNNPKVYKVMVVILGNETQNETKNECITKVGIISRKVNVIQHNSTKEVIKTLHDLIKDLSLKNRRRQAIESDNYALYGALIIGGAILITLVLISILIHTITLFDRWLDRNSELKRPLLKKRSLKKSERIKSYVP